MPRPQTTLGHVLGICYTHIEFERTVYACLSSQLRLTLPETWTLERSIPAKQPACGRTRRGLGPVPWKGPFLEGAPAALQWLAGRRTLFGKKLAADWAPFRAAALLIQLAVMSINSDVGLMCFTNYVCSPFSEKIKKSYFPSAEAKSTDHKMGKTNR